MSMEQVRVDIERLTKAHGHEARKPIRKRIRRAGKKGIPPLMDALSHPDDFTRWEAVSLLGELAGRESAETVTHFALGEDEVHARWRSFWAVCRFDREITRPILQKALHGADPVKCWRAALILSMQGDRSSGPEIIKGLSSNESWIRWEALGAIKSLALPGCESAIAPFLEPGTDVGLRQEAVLALGALGSQQAVALLSEALNDSEPGVRWRVSMALTRTRNPKARDLLKTRLEIESNDSVRQQLTKDIDYLEVNHGNG